MSPLVICKIFVSLLFLSKVNFSNCVEPLSKCTSTYLANSISTKDFLDNDILSLHLSWCFCGSIADADSIRVIFSGYMHSFNSKLCKLEPEQNLHYSEIGCIGGVNVDIQRDNVNFTFNREVPTTPKISVEEFFKISDKELLKDIAIDKTNEWLKKTFNTDPGFEMALYSIFDEKYTVNAFRELEGVQRFGKPRK